MAEGDGDSVAGRIDDLVRQACASVRKPGSTRELGTAFRIAPDYAVTAAHVVDGVQGSVWKLRFFGGEEVSAEVVAVSETPMDGAKVFPESDVAVLKLTEKPVRDVPCVMLGEPVPYRGKALRLCGLNTDMGDQQFERLSVTIEDAVDWYWRIDDAAIRPGRSGGPVYSFADGVVLGFVKSTLHPNVPIGGYCVPLLRALRTTCTDDLYRDIVHSHDGHHASEPRWRVLECGDTASRDRFAKAMGLFSRVGPVPEEAVLDLYRDLFPLAYNDPGARTLLTLRDLAEYILRESESIPNQIPATSRLCHLVMKRPGVPVEVATALADIARDIAATNGIILPVDADYGQLQGRVKAVIGVLTPAKTAVQDGDPHHWEVFVHRGDEVEPWLVGDAATYEQAAECLRMALHEYLSTTEHVIDIEIALPDDRIAEEKLHLWRRRADDPTDLSRFSDAYKIMPRRSRVWDRTTEQREALRRHWTQLNASGGQAIAWLSCRDPRDAQTLHNHLLGYHGLGVDQPPSPHAFDTTASQSYPLMVWRGNCCEDHDVVPPQTCAGTRFRNSLIREFTGVSPTDWSEAINGAHTDLVRGRLEKTDSRYGWHDVVYVLEKPTSNRRLVPLGSGLGGSS